MFFVKKYIYETIILIKILLLSKHNKIFYSV